MLNYDQAFQALTDRGYGPVSARGLLHYVQVTDQLTVYAPKVKPETILTSANAYWRIAARARVAGNARDADRWAGIGDALYEKYLARLAG